MIAGTASSADIALAAMRRRAAENLPYQLAIVDAEMPGMDGSELARAVRSDPLLSKTRLLMMSPVGESAASAALRRKDFDGWLTKPVRPLRLYDALIALLDLGLCWSGPSIPDTVLPAPQIAASPHDPSQDPVRILVVDDNLVNLKVAERQLHKLGYRVDLAGGGKAALEALFSTRYAVVLLDCEMPEMDGYATVAEIRRREGVARHTIVIAMTAHALEGARLHCLDAGMDEYLAKPVSLTALAAVLERCALLAKEGG
jgi:CheY-like chemotaxis protein